MWRKRCLVVAPVLAFVMTVLLMSCGGSSNTATPIPTATPITLVFMRICQQVPSPSASCNQATAIEFPISTAFQLWAQGQFSSNGVNSFQDLSASATWFTSNSNVISNGVGFFATSPKVGCSCITAVSGSMVSPPVLISIGQPGSACAPCPTSPPG